MLAAQDGSGNELQTASVNALGQYSFPTPFASGQNYTIVVKTQPGVPSQNCTLANPTGQVVAANVTNVDVACTTNSFTVSGTVKTLTDPVTLKNNGGDDIVVSAVGTSNFTFSTPVLRLDRSIRTARSDHRRRDVECRRRPRRSESEQHGPGRRGRCRSHADGLDVLIERQCRCCVSGE